jgi:hypothetical protein
LGGLGIPDLDRSGRALRLRWLWLQWTDPTRPWSGSNHPCDDADRALFRACTKIELGDGKKASFWHDKWCDRGPLHEWAQDLYKIANRKKKNSRKGDQGQQLDTFYCKTEHAYSAFPISGDLGHHRNPTADA